MPKVREKAKSADKGPDIIALTSDLDEKERQKFRRVMRVTKARQKSGKKQKKVIPKLAELVKNNEARLEDEKTFAHNVTVTSKHERRRRLRVRWRLYTFLIVGGFILLLAGYLIFSYVLVVDSVSVEGTERYAPDDIIAASGITVGERLFSPSIRESDIEATVTDRFPYIAEVKIERRLPDRIVISVTEEDAAFISVIHGQYVVLSAGLRVLSITDEDPGEDLIKLKLPDVAGAVYGKEITFDDDMFDVVKKAADAVCTEQMREGTSVLDVSDRFNITISYGGRFRLEIGLVNDIDMKLKAAFRVMEDKTFADGNKGTINLRNVREPTAIIDNEIDLD